MKGEGNTEGRKRCKRSKVTKNRVREGKVMWKKKKGKMKRSERVANGSEGKSVLT